MTRPHHHHVYVVELSRDVLYEPRFKKCNPDMEVELAIGLREEGYGVWQA